MRLSVFILTTAVTLASAFVSFGQTNFYEQVSSLWYLGQKTNVLNIAEQRLQQNTNDIAGLLLKMEYEITFVELDKVTNTMARVLQVGDGITSTNFAAAFPLVKADINHLISMIPLYPANELATDRAKGNIAHKPLIHGAAIKALQKDGYFPVVLAAQVTLKPEALSVNPGILTAFVRLPAGYPVGNITSATCDGAPSERMMLNEDGTEMIIKFRRRDIEAALAQIGESIDTNFVVRGVWRGAAETNFFQGADSITKIVGAKGAK